MVHNVVYVLNVGAPFFVFVSFGEGSRVQETCRSSEPARETAIEKRNTYDQNNKNNNRTAIRVWRRRVALPSGAKRFRAKREHLNVRTRGSWNETRVLLRIRTRRVRVVINYLFIRDKQ
jgi:hypothetical protein